MKRIHVNHHKLREDEKAPAILIHDDHAEPRYAREVEILGPSRIVQDPTGLENGSKVWIETDSDLLFLDQD